jgi:hypothetical protein
MVGRGDVGGCCVGLMRAEQDNSLTQFSSVTGTILAFLNCNPAVALLCAKMHRYADTAESDLALLAGN